MKLSNIEVLITKVEAKKSTKDNSDYIAIGLLDLKSGDTFDLISRDIQMMRLKQMCKYIVSLNLSSSKFGLRLEIEKIGEELGSI